MTLTARIATIAAPLAAPAADARRRWFEREGLLLQIDDGEGHVGQGEASPLPGYSPDMLERARASLRAIAWESVDVPSEDAPALELPRALEEASASSPSARAALEAAFLDLVAQRRGEPLHRMLRAMHGAGAVTSVPLAALLPMDGVRDARDLEPALDAALAYAEARVGEGITAFKAKVGADLDRELAFLEAFRARFRHPCALRLDANQSLREEDAPRTLARLAELEPEYVEEPLPLEALFRLQERAPVRVALDESLQAPDSELLAGRALDEGLAHALVLKPGALGGLLRSARLAHDAARRGASSSVSHLYDGPVARAAGAELALALERPAAAGLARHGGLELWPEAVSPALRGGRIEPHDAPGLGLSPLWLPV